MNMTDTDFQRLEAKVDKLTDAIQRLGKCEANIAVHDQAINKTDKKVDQWINRGVGVWAAAAVLFTLVQFGAKFFGK